MSCLNLKANDSLRLNSTKPKLHKHFLGFDLGGPGLIYSVNYKRGFNLKQKITNYGVIGIVYGDFISNSQYIGIPIRMENNFKIYKNLYLSNQIVMLPYLNFSPYPKNRALRQQYIRTNYNSGLPLIKPLQFIFNESVGISIDYDKINFQIFSMVFFYKNIIYFDKKYQFGLWGQFSLNYKLN